MSPTSPRTRRLTAPLVLALGALLLVETIGGLWIFVARVLEPGHLPGLSLHWWAGWALSAVYVVYLVRHVARVAPLRPRLDYALGMLAAATLTLVQVTGSVVGWSWWRQGQPRDHVFTPWLSGAHDMLSMMTLSFVAAHLGAVLLRDARVRARRDRAA